MRAHDMAMLQASEMARLTQTARMLDEILAPRRELARFIEEAERNQRWIRESMPVIEQHRSVMEMLGPALEERRGIVEALPPMAATWQRLGEMVESRLSPLQALARMPDPELARMSALQQAMSRIPESTLLSGGVLQVLDRIPAHSLFGAFEQVESLSTLRGWIESASIAALGLPDAAASVFADLVEDELTELNVAAADSAALDRATLIDVLLAVLNSLGELGKHPDTRSLLIALFAAFAGVRYQAEIVAPDHQEVLAEMRRQTVLLERIHEGQGQAGGDSRREGVSDLRGVVIHNAHVRAAADAESRSFGVLLEGDEVLILGHEGGWLRVIAGLPGGDLQAGWVYARFVKAVP